MLRHFQSSFCSAATFSNFQPSCSAVSFPSFGICECLCVMVYFAFFFVAGVVSTVAGGGGSSLSGYVDGVGSLARFYYPYGVSILSTGDMVVADTFNNVIRKITSSGALSFPFNSFVLSFVCCCNCFYDSVCVCVCIGVVSTVAGGGGSTLSGYMDGVGTAPRFNNPYGVLPLSTGDFMVTDTHNHVIRKITSSGTHHNLITTSV